MPSETARHHVLPEDEHNHGHTGESHAQDLRWTWGLLVTLIGTGGICWLGATGQLDLYVHPRLTLSWRTFGATLRVAGLRGM